MNRISRVLSLTIVLAVSGRAAVINAALPQHRQPRSTNQTSSLSIPHSASFREVNGLGLLIRTWVNDVGPFNFAIDTGAGATLISRRTADEAHVTRTNERHTLIGGLSGVETTAYHAVIRSLTVGDANNRLPAKGESLIVEGLPNDVDGVLDPTEAFSPLGYVVDLPRHELSAFDPALDPVRTNDAPEDGAVVNWVRDPHGRRPFVVLDNGDHALLDTGSQFGLAIRDPNSERRSNVNSVRDVGGGHITSRRGTSNISIGSLTLRRIPTDMVSGAEADAPVLLGLAALRPFRLRLDPLHRLIEIAPSLAGR